uniref:Plus3 domain-containing protein n=1 Tax=Vitis vinifera TaxID=29760 RepID=F6HG03_VITVI
MDKNIFKENVKGCFLNIIVGSRGTHGSIF